MNPIRSSAAPVLRRAVDKLRLRHASLIRSTPFHQHAMYSSKPGEQVDLSKDKLKTTEMSEEETVNQIDLGGGHEEEEAQSEAPSSEVVRPRKKVEMVEPEPLFPPEMEAEREMVEMWNKKAPAGPEWGGPREYEPTRYGDWARNGRVSDF